MCSKGFASIFKKALLSPENRPVLEDHLDLQQVGPMPCLSFILFTYAIHTFSLTYILSHAPPVLW